MRRSIFLLSFKPLFPLVLLLSIMGSWILLTGCDDTASEDTAELEPQNPEILETVTPAVWMLGSDEFRQLKIKIKYPEDLRLAMNQGTIPRPNVTLSLTLPDSTTIIPMFDDGGYGEIIDDYSWTDSHSGDLVPNDFEYSVRLNSLFTAEIAEITAKYKVVTIVNDGMSAQIAIEEEDTLEVLFNRPPEVISLDVPDSLHAGFDEGFWTAIVDDPDPGVSGEVTAVSLKIFLDGTQKKHRDLTQDSQNLNEWRTAVDATFAIDLPTNVYRFEVNAIDAPGSQAETFIKEIWVENSTPVILTVETPDTVERPLEDLNHYDFFLTFEDLQGQGDVDRVYYEVKPASSDQFFPNDSYTFRDDGLFNDEVAEDGIWSGGIDITYDSQSEDFGNWTFRFLVDDRGGNTSLPFDVFIYYRQGESK